MSFTIKNHLIVAFLLSGCVLFVGCGDSNRSGGRTTGLKPPAYTISVEDLASKLGLTVRKAGDPYFELGNAQNTVRLFTYKGGRAYVNGTPVGEVGTIAKVGGKSYVSELLTPKIRGHLIASAPVQIPGFEPYKPPRPIGTGTVVIDPGHGGKDPGAKSVLGYWEKDINLNIAHKTASYLRQSGVQVIMTRDSDTYPELEARAALANRNSADLFVSIHCDSNGDRIHRGFTIYRARSASWGSKKLGNALEKNLSNTGIPSKGLRGADYKVLVQTQMPAVLVECGFLSNYDEAALLKDPWYQSKIGRAIADGIIEAL